MARMIFISRWSRPVLVSTAAIVVLLFMAFVIHSRILGGSAISGYVQGSTYFACMHGKCREVSPEDWTLNYQLALFGLGGLPIVPIELLVLLLLGKVDLKRENTEDAQ